MKKTLLTLIVPLLISAAAAQQPKIVKYVIQQQELSSAADYWTPERRASAVPKELAISPSATRTPSKEFPTEPLHVAPGQLPEIQGPLGDASAEYWTPENAATLERSQSSPLAAIEPLSQPPYPYPYGRYTVLAKLKNDYPYKAVGKLFFTLSGVNYVCSASVIRPHLLLTARHCMFDPGTARWATNVVFYPGYAGSANSALGGAWYARMVITWTGGAQEYDIGFIQTFNKNRTGCKATSSNKQIESYTGTLGYAWGGNYGQKHFDLFGYPQAAPFNGKVLVQCEASTGELAVGGIVNTFEVGCDQTGGTSGGPWLHTFLPGSAGANNYVRSLSSFRWSNRPESLDGPVFGATNFNSLLTSAQQLPCP